MKKGRTVWITLSAAFVIIFTSVVLFIDPLLDAAGSFLVIDDEPKKSDVIFVPSGGGGMRFIKAIALLKSGFADRIVFLLEKKSEETKAFERKYGNRFSTRARVEHIMDIEGIDSTRVIIPEPRSGSTKEDFQLLRDFMKKERLTSVIVTSSWFHLRRCKLSAERQLDKGIEIYFVPANLPDKNHFINRSKRILGLFIAYLQLTYYYVTAF